MIKNKDQKRAHYEFGLWAKHGKHFGHLWFSTCNPGILSFLKTLTKDSPEVSAIRSSYGEYADLPKFISWSENPLNWGFGKVLSEMKEQKRGWETRCISLYAAQEYKAKGKDRRIAAITATLSLIAQAIMRNEDYQSNDRRAQVFEIDSWNGFGITGGHYDCSSSYRILFPTLQWIETGLLSTAVPAIQKVLFDTYKLLIGKDKSFFIEESDFSTHLDSSQIVVIIDPMLGVVLNGEREEDSEDHSLLLTSGNSYSPFYQLLMLVAMAKIHDLARMMGGI